jgi:hypothetical protein
MKCPSCEKGNLKNGLTREYMFGVFLGEFLAEVCVRCAESFTDEATTKKIEQAARKKGVWGLGADTKITKTGNSLAVRIPKKLADYLNLKPKDSVYIHPEADKLVIDTRI